METVNATKTLCKTVKSSTAQDEYRRQAMSALMFMTLIISS